MHPIPPLEPRNAAIDFWRGAMLPFRAFSTIATTPSLFGWTVLCAVVTAGALLGVAWGSASLSSLIADWAVAQGSWWRTAAHATIVVVSWVVLVAVGALTVPNVVLAPLVDLISEATEVKCGGFTAPAFSVGLLLRGGFESLTHTLLRLALMLAGFVVLAPLNLVPGVGSAVWLVGSTVWSAFWLAVEHVGNPMVRHLRPFGEVLRLVWSRRALCLGFGLSLWVVLWVPVVNCLLMPIAVVAGTLLFRGLQGNAAGDAGVGVP